jgi:hypothetical protein
MCEPWKGSGEVQAICRQAKTIVAKEEEMQK